MNVGNYFTQGRRGWVRLHEEGGKGHEAPCLHKLEAYLDGYIWAAGIAGDKDGQLVRSTDARPAHRTAWCSKTHKATVLQGGEGQRWQNMYQRLKTDSL
jgi:hypothetical protein